MVNSSNINSLPILIWGASGHALVLLDAIDNKANIFAFVDRDANTASPLPNVPLMKNMTEVRAFLNSSNITDFNFILAIGGARGADRKKLKKSLVSCGGHPMNVVSTSANISESVVLGDSIQVLHGTYLGPKVILGNNSIINNKASIDHETIIGSECHIGPAATLCGCVVVGSNTFIGAGSVVLPRIEIGNNVIIGAGAVVTKNVNSYTIVVGNPAHPIDH